MIAIPRGYLVLSVFFLFFLEKCQSPNSNPVSKEDAMVVTANPKASEVGKEILKQGGNAVDAAIAVQFALAVVYPTAGNIGGGGFMVTKFDSSYYSLDFREKAPLKAKPSTYQDSNGKPLAHLSLKGHLASGVPGTVKGMTKAHEKWGSLPFTQLLTPAIKLAKKGFPVTKAQAERFNKFLRSFKKYSTFKPKPFTREYPWRKGDILRQKALAKTLKRIRENGSSGFYSGKTAELMVQEMKRCNGLITKKDLKRYEAKFRAPVKGEFRNFEIISAGPPSSGGVCLVQLLKIVENYPLAQWGFHSTKTVHLMAEAEKRIYADRSKHLGDPDFYQVPIKQLMANHYLKKRMKNFSMDNATSSSNIHPGEPRKTGQQTTHFSIVDSKRNAVSITTTLNTQYGSKVWVGQAGFFLNSEMNDFSLKPGYPNVYGLTGGKANAIKPGKRMLSSMTPTIISKEGDLKMVLGSPGGSTIISSVFQTVLNTTVYGMNMQEAVNKGRFHHQWKPDYIFTEFNRPLSISTMINLFGKGHILLPIPYIGNVNAIKVTSTGKLEGGADPRGNNQVKGF